MVSTVAGDGTQAFRDNVPALNSSLKGAAGVATDGTSLYIALYGSHCIRKVDIQTSNITTVAGMCGTAGYCDGVIAQNTPCFYLPLSLALDQTASVLYIGVTGNCPGTNSPDCRRIARLDLDTLFVTTLINSTFYHHLNDPYFSALALTPYSSRLLFTDSANAYLGSVDLSYANNVTVLAGHQAGGVFNGDNIPAEMAQLNNPQGLAVDLAGNIYISVTGHYRVRMINVTTNMITTIAGTGTYGFASDGSPALQSRLGYIVGVATNSAGTVFFVDAQGGSVWQVTTGILSLVAGSNNGTSALFDGRGPTAMFGNPQGLCYYGNTLYVAENDNNRVRRIAGV